MSQPFIVAPGLSAYKGREQLSVKDYLGDKLLWQASTQWHPEHSPLCTFLQVEFTASVVVALFRVATGAMPSRATMRPAGADVLQTLEGRPRAEPSEQEESYEPNCMAR
jgi:hypothetical protein